MVYRGLILWVVVLTERGCHQTADKKMPALTITAETDTQIALIIHERREKASIIMFEALNPSHIADEVFALIAFNRSPFLVRQIWYLIHKNTSFIITNLPPWGGLWNKGPKALYFKARGGESAVGAYISLPIVV